MKIQELKDLNFEALLSVFKDKEEQLNKILELLFKLIKEEGITALKDYSFLEGLQIPDHLLEKYQNKDILYILALHKSEPVEKIISLALKLCTYEEIYSLNENGVISEEKLLAKLKEPATSDYIIKQITTTTQKPSFCIIHTLKYLLLAEDPEIIPITTKIIDQISKCKMYIGIYNFLASFLVNEIQDTQNEFIDTLKEKPVLLVIYKIFLKNSTLMMQSNLNILSKDYLLDLIERIKKGEYHSLAWVMEVFKETSLSKYINLIDIINAWLVHENTLAYEIYSDYLFSETQAYEIGKDLDLKYKTESRKGSRK